jgi:hypothetical protein
VVVATGIAVVGVHTVDVGVVAVVELLADFVLTETIRCDQPVEQEILSVMLKAKLWLTKKGTHFHRWEAVESPTHS